VWQYFAVPDEKLGWVPFAVHAGKRILQEHHIDAIYVTGKPFSSYLIGQRLSRRFGIPWVMDLRDLWTLNRRVRPKNWLRKVLEPRLERRLLRSASVVVVNTPGNRDDFVEAFPECPPEKFVAITNGYDKDDFADLGSTKYEKFTIGYTGAVYWKKGQARNGALYDTYSPKYLFQALRELFREEPEMRSRLEVVFTGPSCGKVERLVSECGFEELNENLRLRGWVSYKESLQLLKRSHLVCLTLSNGEESNGWIPSKLFQYMASGTSILALVCEGDVAQIVRETQSGMVVTPDDVGRIKSLIRERYNAYRTGEAAYQPNASLIERYESRQLAALLAECLNRAVGINSVAER
jgi:glycosyltransferase involved in cell wall biosynthesis